MNRSKRNETNQNLLPSIRLKSYRNETRRIERNRIEIGLLSIRHYRRNPWVDSITFDSFRFDRLASIDSAISVGEDIPFSIIINDVHRGESCEVLKLLSEAIITY